MLECCVDKIGAQLTGICCFLSSFSSRRKRAPWCKTNTVFASVEAGGSLHKVGNLAWYSKHSVNFRELMVTDYFLFIPEEEYLFFFPKQLMNVIVFKCSLCSDSLS